MAVYRIALVILAGVLAFSLGCAQAPPFTEIPKPRHSSPRKTVNEQRSENLINKVGQLLGQLASSDYRERERAHLRLAHLLNTEGAPVLAILQKTAMTAKDPEVQKRVRQILAPYSRWKITPAVLDALPNIFEILEKNSPGSMRTAIEILRKLDPQHTRGLLFAIVLNAEDDPFPGKRRVIEALVENANDEVVRFFVERLIREGEGDGITWQHEHILKRMGEKSIAAVSELLRQTGNYRIGCSAAAILAGTGEKGRQVLAEILKTGKPAAKVAALRGFLYYPRIKLPAQKIFKLTGSANDEIRAGAVRLLARTGYEKAIETLSTILSSDASGEVRLNAALALMEAGDERAAPALVKALGDSHAGVRRYAAKALIWTGDKRAVRPLFEAIDDPDPDVASAATATFQFLRRPVVPELLELLKTVEPPKRWLVVHTLSNIRDERAIPALFDLAKDKDPKARREAVDALDRFRGEQVVEALINALKDADAKVRVQAVKSLGSMADTSMVPALIKALSDSDASVRGFTAKVLCKIGDRRAAGPLVKVLKDSEPAVCFHAVRGLAEFGDESAFDPLLKALRDKKTQCGSFPKALVRTGGKKAAPHLIKLFDSMFEKEAVRAVVSLGEEAAAALLEAAGSERYRTRANALHALALLREEKAFGMLLGELKSENQLVRMTAARAITLYKDSRAVDPLISLLRDKHASMRETAAFLLGQLHARRAVKPLIDILLHDEDEDAAMAAACALGDIGDGVAIEPLVCMLLDDRENVCQAATTALGAFRDNRTLDALIKRLGDETGEIADAAMDSLARIADIRAVPAIVNSGVSDRSAAALRKLRTSQGLDFFLAILERDSRFMMREGWYFFGAAGVEISFDGIADCRMTAIYALGESGDRRAIGPLKKLLGSNAARVRMTAAVALLHLGNEQGTKILKKALASDNSEQQREAARALSESPCSEALPWLVETLKSRHCRVRSHAAEALGKLGDERACAPLIGALKDEDSLVRCEAAFVLAKFKEKRALEPLVGLLAEDPVDHVREAAHDALHEITHQNFGWNYQAWRRWLKRRER